ncbi:MULTISPECIES: FecR family protein [Chitinophagaceae]
MTESDWNAFMQEERWLRSDRVWDNVAKKLRHRSYRNKKVWTWGSAAACLVLVLFLYLNPHRDDSILKEHIITVAGLGETKTIRNDAGKDMHFTLPDGSNVILYPHSALTYNEDFNTKKRDVCLDGDAKFEVFKDKTRPFSVFSGHTVTTALGTVFWVRENNDIDRVTLLEGKVIVRQYANGKIGEKLALLMPGEEFVYNTIAKKESVSRRRTDRNASSTTIMEHSLDMDKWTVEQVLDSLSEMKKIRIEYAGDAFKRTLFTGTYNPAKMTAKGFLEELCLLNGWTLEQTNTHTYRIVSSTK